jgi:hypothetical protein
MKINKPELEANLHQNICSYIRQQYPKVLFNTDLSGLKLTLGQAVKVKQLRSSNGFPDLMIFYPNKNYHGLFIELKKDGTKLYKKDGITPVNEHIKEQFEIIDKLGVLGYCATFGIGFDEVKQIIDLYMQ